MEKTLIVLIIGTVMGLVLGILIGGSILAPPCPQCPECPECPECPKCPGVGCDSDGGGVEPDPSIGQIRGFSWGDANENRIKDAGEGAMTTPPVTLYWDTNGDSVFSEPADQLVDPAVLLSGLNPALVNPTTAQYTFATIPRSNLDAWIAANPGALHPGNPPCFFVVLDPPPANAVHSPSTNPSTRLCPFGNVKQHDFPVVVGPP